jgi:hypothetical protein
MLTRHEAKKVLIVARKIQDAVDEALEVLTNEERHHAEATWAGRVRGLTICRDGGASGQWLPVAEAELLLDSGAVQDSYPAAELMASNLAI